MLEDALRDGGVLQRHASKGALHLHFASTLFDCGTIDWQTGLHDVAYASTAAFEEVLMCRDHSAEFASLKTNPPDVGDFQEMP